MTKLIITRGLPASGKTTYAKLWVEAEPNRVRVNRDDLRGMLHDGIFQKGITEHQVIVARDAIIESSLKRGISVISDDTNLPERVAKDLRRISRRVGAEFEVIDFSHVPLETCIQRNRERDKSVREEVIRDFHSRFIKGRILPLALPEGDNLDLTVYEPYSANADRQKAIVVDIDGTVALRGARGPFEEDKIPLDTPNVAVVAAVQHYRFLGYQVIFCSGRSDACYTETKAWLERHVLAPVHRLEMRRSGDMRKDCIVKYELFNTFRDDYDIRVVFDDRDQVVEMWRKLGLTVFQVADGNF